jgi:hypothetical protein
MTIWREIPSLPNYEASSEGEIRSVTRFVDQGSYRCWRRGRILSSNPSTKTGHLRIHIRTKGKGTNYYVHTLVCEAFHGPRPFPDWEVRHLDGNATNNQPGNLKWGTKSENRRDAVRHGDHYNASKTHCKWGHEFNEENTRRDADGRRWCRRCDCRRQAEIRARRSAA